MFENLRKLYSYYGGRKAIVTSGYFWVSILLAALSYQSIADYEWSDKAVSIMPSLTGFTIAAFAIIFAILRPEMLKKLIPADIYGRSPIVEIAASIGHAVFIQVSAMIIAISSKLIDLNPAITYASDWIHTKGYSPLILIRGIDWLTMLISAIGMFFTYYGVMLVLASILSIFRMQLIVANTTNGRLAGASKSPPRPSPPPS